MAVKRMVWRADSVRMTVREVAIREDDLPPLHYATRGDAVQAVAVMHADRLRDLRTEIERHERRAAELEAAGAALAKSTDALAVLMGMDDGEGGA